MPATFELTSDVVRDTLINEQNSAQGLPIFVQYDRIFYIRTIGETDAALLAPQAKAYLQTIVPKGTPHPNFSICTARNYLIQDLDSDDTVKGTVSYIYNQVSGDPTIWTINSDSYTEDEETDVEYDSDGNLNPIAVRDYILGWTDPGKYPTGDGAAFETPAYGTVIVPRPLKRWTYTKTIYGQATAMTYDAATVNYVGRVNSTIFTGYAGTSPGGGQGLSCPVGTVLCFDAGATLALYNGNFLGTAVMVYKPQGWQPWVRYSNPNLGGVPDNIWRASAENGNRNNGTYQTKAIPSTDLNQLMNLLP